MAGVAQFIVNESPVEGYGANVTEDSFADDVHAPSLEYGAVVFSRSFRVAKNQTRTLILYFPNTWHANTHGRTSATNAEIAGQNIINGKWRDWWNRTVASFAWDAERELNRKVDMLYTREMRRSRAEWNRIAHTKDYQKQWKAFKNRVAKLRERHINAKTISLEKMPDFWSLADNSGMSMMEQTEWVKQQRAAFITRKQQADTERKALWRKITSLTAKSNVSALKRQLVSQFRTKEWRDAIDALNSEIIDMEAPTNRRELRASMRLQDRMRMLEDPWSFGINAENALRHAGESIVEDMKDALHGAKSPGLAERTMKNRRYRGNPETPPLDETGEFIESLSFAII